ncbi:uncharacterized protein LOC116290009 [Actinia tenebrosa]|uniref:Uncharacterized protein LOC116290009 n=1 Tax=Actinia tenebrosa TaxID=6105 RepID=A0A6P8HJR9_ACTTE|nr:uncharacterized protein LOC116290009 [Actinia tenebrosa]
MDVLTLKNDENDVPSSSLFEVNPECFLSDLRTRIMEEVPDLLPHDFRFLFPSSGVRISLRQEARVAVKAVSYTEGVGHYMRFVEEKRDPTYPPEKKEQTVFDLGESVCPPTSTSSVKQVCEKEPNKEPIPEQATVMGLKSPEAWLLKGIKIYKEKEIEDARGKEKERRIFWNAKAKILAKSDLKKTQIYEEIHKAWRLKKTEILLGESSGVRMASTSMKKGTLEKNKERFQLAKRECETLSDKIKELMKTKSAKTEQQMIELRELQSNFDIARSTLRKAQDALRKNIKKSS